MAARTFQLRFELDELEPWVDDQPYENFVKDLFRAWVAKGFLEEEVNQGLEVQYKVNIALTGYTNDEATFEVVDGYASPCLRHSAKQYVIDN